MKSAQSNRPDNPVTQRLHREDVFWQITLPLVVGISAGIILAVLTVVGSQRSAETVSRWADISLIWLILPGMFGALVLMALFGSLAYLVLRLIGVLPGYTRQAQDLFLAASFESRLLSDRLVRPILRLNEMWASWSRLFRG